MGSVPDDRTLRRCQPIIDGAVRRTALEHALPWHLSELRIAAFEGLRVASGRRTDSLGMPFEEQARPWIRKKAAEKGHRLRAATGEAELPRPPSSDCIEPALGFFSAEEWRRLIGVFDGRDTGALWTHLNRNKDRLRQSLGRGKLYDILDAIGTRNVELMCRSGPWKKIVISDALWVAYWQKLAREQNVARAPRPFEKRFWAEVGGPNNIRLYARRACGCQAGSGSSSNVSAMFPDNLALPSPGTVVPVMLHWWAVYAGRRPNRISCSLPRTEPPGPNPGCLRAAGGGRCVAPSVGPRRRDRGRPSSRRGRPGFWGTP